MAEVVNLRTARKRKAKAAEADQAAENRIKFGRTKAEKDLEQAKLKLSDKQLDAHKLKD